MLGVKCPNVLGKYGNYALCTKCTGIEKLSLFIVI